MVKTQSEYKPPKIIPALRPVKTERTVVINGKRFPIVKLERAERSDVDYRIKRAR